jgi:hypothetical protein
MLPLAKEQPGESQRYGGLENTTTFGVAAKRARDNDEQLHTNQVREGGDSRDELAAVHYSLLSLVGRAPRRVV